MLSCLSVITQSKSQHHWESHPKDKCEALQEPKVPVLVAPGSVVLLEIRGVASLVAADVWENVHRGHIKESPS